MGETNKKKDKTNPSFFFASKTGYSSCSKGFDAEADEDTSVVAFVKALRSSCDCLKKIKS